MSIHENFWSSFCYCLDKAKHFIFRSWHGKTISCYVSNAAFFHCKLACAGSYLFENLLLDFLDPELLFCGGWKSSSDGRPTGRTVFTKLWVKSARKSFSWINFPFGFQILKSGWYRNQAFTAAIRMLCNQM